MHANAIALMSVTVLLGGCAAPDATVDAPAVPVAAPAPVFTPTLKTVTTSPTVLYAPTVREARPGTAPLLIEGIPANPTGAPALP